MVPPSLKEKWPADFKLFEEKCLPPEMAAQMKFGRAERAVEFLKFLDDPPERKKSIVFITHGAMSRGLQDKWVMLALIQRALKYRHNIDRWKKELCNIMGELLQMKWAEVDGVEVWRDLLNTPPNKWLDVLHDHNVDPEHDDDPTTDDDPVPQAVLDVLPDLDMKDVYESLKKIPVRRTKKFDEKIGNARREMKNTLRELWQICVRKLRIKLPLLILDEAHHLKNSKTRLASLFQVSDAEEDADELSHGPLAGVFERMLFLTATPFQLGHHELCNVLDRFNGIAWKGANAPPYDRSAFQEKMKNLRTALDSAQESALTLDTAWGRLQPEDMVIDGKSFTDSDSWWEDVQSASGISPHIEDVLRSYQRTREKMKEAEALIQPWVVRHRKQRCLPKPSDSVPRRNRLPGKSICLECGEEKKSGIAVENRSLLPFLLAARAASHNPESRPVFAEGLASSYEAFLQTRLVNMKAREGQVVNFDECTDSDDDTVGDCDITDAGRWYLDQLDRLVPRGDAQASLSHPKISATVQRVTDIWKKGEKVLVFCHYIATGKTLRRRISGEINPTINPPKK